MNSKEPKTRPVPAPRLRFPGFTEAWEEKKLGDIATVVTEKVGSKKLIPVSISAGIGFVPQAEKFGRDISGLQYKLYTLARDGEFVFNKGNSKTYPEGAIYLLEGWGEVAAPNVFIIFRLKEGYVNDFFRYIFEKNVHGEQLRSHITSGARSNGLLNISKETFFGISLPVTSTAEQTRIAAALASLDAVIVAHQSKQDALREHKRGLMAGLFPAEGKRIPRLRFSEFDGAEEWVEKKLGALAEVVRGGSPRPIEAYMTTASDGLNWLKIGDVDKEAKYISGTRERVIRSALSKTRSIQQGDLILSNSMSFGRPYISRITACIHDGWIAITKIRNYVLSEFLYYYISSEIPQNYFLSKAAGSGVKNLNAEIIKALPISIPSLPEQARIVAVLSFLDDLIAAQSENIAALQTFKRGLMQDLFPTGCKK